MTKDGKVAVGIIGFGGIARGAHLTSGYRKLPDWCDVVAVADILPERCADASGQYGIPETYATHAELLARDDIDAVSICTGNYAHAPITIDALRAGKHVLCEKPMAMNADECKAMIAAQKETGKKLQIGFNMRYSPGAQSLKRAIEGRGVWRDLPCRRTCNSPPQSPGQGGLYQQGAQWGRAADRYWGAYYRHDSLANGPSQTCRHRGKRGLQDGQDPRAGGGVGTVGHERLHGRGLCQRLCPL